MYHIMTVIDNRTMLREICEYLEALNETHMHCVLYSAEAFHWFVELHPDIIILDAEAMLYYRTILEQFRQSQWDYRVLLIIGKHHRNIADSHVICIEKKNLMKDTLLSCIKESYQQIHSIEPKPLTAIKNRKGQFAFIDYPNSYLFLYARCISAKQQVYLHKDTDDMQKMLSGYGESDLAVTEEGHVLFLLRKSTRLPEAPVQQIGKLLLSQFESQYTVFALENLRWEDLEEGYGELLQYAPYCYFLQGEICIINADQIQTKPISFNELDGCILAIINAILRNQHSSVKELLRELYLHKIKESCDLTAREYLHWMLPFYFPFVGGQPKQSLEMQFDTVEQEFAFVENAITSMTRQMVSKALPDVLLKSLLYLFGNFHENITLESASFALSFNKNYISRLFRQYFDTTFLELLQSLRIHKAQFLLLNTNFRISQIANEVGYPDHHYFGRLYKKRVGNSPDAYRRLNHADLKKEG